MSQAADEALRQHLGQLEAAGLLLPTGIDGLAGRSGTFEAIASGVAAAVQDAGRDQGAEVRRFPPVVPAEVVLRGGYLRSFPDLLGVVHGFRGGDREHAELLARAEGGGDWADGMTPTGAALCAAACHPLYPTIGGPLPAAGRVYDVLGWIFRNEPSPDPARMQTFRQYEFVFVGSAEGAGAHRDLWRDRAVELLTSFGLGVHAEVANDPFFGRAGRILRSSQLDSAAKWEVVGPTGPAPRLTALASANDHGDHFGHAFGLDLDDGTTAHSACVGFGLERITLALLWEHGLDVAAWPGDLRRTLQL